MLDQQIIDQASGILTALEDTEALEDAISTEANLARELKDNASLITLEEAAIVMVEKAKGKEGAINGTNEPTRKTQTLLLLQAKAQAGDHYGRLCDTRQRLELALSQAKVEKEIQLQRFSALRHRARLVTGMLRFLAASSED